MDVHCKYDEMVRTKALKNHPKNRNKHGQDQIDRLSELYKYHGVRHPIIVSRLSGFIVAGHGRKLAAIRAGFDSFPVVYQDFESAEKEYAFLQADNAIASWAELDIDNIKLDIGDFPELDLNMLGIRDFQIEELKEFLTDPDDVPEYVEPICKLGQTWKLGEHRLMCGDSTDLASVGNLMNGEIADITFTSPPYNANKNAGGLIEKKYKNSEDAMSDEEYVAFLTAFTSLSLKYSRYVFVNIQMLSHNRKPLFDWQNEFKLKIKDILIWVKNVAPPQINKGTFNSKWEYVFCFSEDSESRAFPCDWHGKYFNVIETENASRNEYAKIHKATFPVSFPMWVIEKMEFCKSVLDLFGGSGTTLIACEKTNRKCYMMELDPHYCDVIIARWEKFTGNKAELLNG